MRVIILTPYPEMFPGALGHSIIGNALDNKKFSLETINLHDFGIDKRGSIDDQPFGGGPGMILRPDVVEKAVLSIKIDPQKNTERIYLTPAGKLANQAKLGNFSKLDNLIILCGRFEGVDQRAIDVLNFEEISIGDYILSGGEVAAIVILDSILRLVPGVIGNENSTKEESFENGLLEYPQYTKPQTWEKKSVPDVLLSGDHGKIKDWRLSQSEAITRDRRPDLWHKYKKN